MVDLPQELVGQIIDELSDDGEALRAAALVSPAFLPWARQHLFSSVRITAANLYAFCALVASSPSVASYIRRLDVPTMPSLPGSTILTPSTLAALPHATHLSSHSDPFDFRRLDATQMHVLAAGTRNLTTVNIFIDRLWALPYWATLLDECPALHTLTIRAESTGWAAWTAADVAFAMPPPRDTVQITTLPRLHTLRLWGDVKILTPIRKWLLPRGALDALHTLEIDVLYLADDYDAPERDSRPALVRAAAQSLEELTLHLDPPMPLDTDNTSPPLSLSSFPRLRTLYLRDGPDSDISESLVWLVEFLKAQPDPSAQSHSGLPESALEELTLDHGILRRDLLAVPVHTWATLDDALISNSDHCYPHLRTLTFCGYHKYSGWMGAVPREAQRHFEETVRARLPALMERGVLKVGKM